MQQESVLQPLVGRLGRSIGAVELGSYEQAEGRLGLVRQLALGSIVELWGDGFNEGTAKVRCQRVFYFVRRSDLPSDLRER
jgi:hypothetical protein